MDVFVANGFGLQGYFPSYFVALSSWTDHAAPVSQLLTHVTEFHTRLMVLHFNNDNNETFFCSAISPVKKWAQSALDNLL